MLMAVFTRTAPSTVDVSPVERMVASPPLYIERTALSTQEDSSRARPA